jgi:ribosomal protein L10
MLLYHWFFEGVVMVTASQNTIAAIHTRPELIQSLHGRFKEDYLRRILHNPDEQVKAERIAETEKINIYAAWYKLLTSRARG